MGKRNVATEGAGRTPHWGWWGIRGLAGEKEAEEMMRILRGLHISGNRSCESHNVHPVPARLLGVEGTHCGRILLIHLIHVRLI